VTGRIFADVNKRSQIRSVNNASSGYNIFISRVQHARDPRQPRSPSMKINIFTASAAAPTLSGEPKKPEAAQDGSLSSTIIKLFDELLAALSKQSSQEEAAEQAQAQQPSLEFAAMPQPSAGAADAQPAADAPGEAAADPQAERQETIATLGRHEGAFKSKPSAEDRQKMIDDPKTPPDLKRALEHVARDPELRDKIDSAKNGKVDGHISSKDINKLQEDPEQRAYAKKRSQSYEQNYIPSDVQNEKDAKPRPITNNDAKRELFRYSDDLPKHISMEELRKVADGSSKQGKAPPQLQAAAQYYVNHPDEYARDIGDPNGSTSRGDMLNGFSRSIHLNADEHKTLETIGANRDTFFADESLSRDKLQDIAKDPKSKPECKKAAEKLLADPMLYSMLDNGKHGSKSSATYKVDDQKIGGKDFDVFNDNKSKEVAKAPKATTAAGKVDAKAVRDMAEGLYNQPDAKHGKGGFLRDVGSFITKAVSVVAKIGSAVLGGLAALKIPGISQFAGLGSVAAAGVGGAMDVAHTAIEGGNVKNAGKMAGLEVAAAGVGALVAPGAGQGIKAGAQAGAKAGVEAGAKAGATAGAKAGAEAGAEAGAKAGAQAGVKGGASEAAEGSAAAGAKQAGSPWGDKAFAAGSDVTNSDVAKKAATKAAGSAATQTAGAVYGHEMGDHSASVAARSGGESLAEPDQAPGA
jgi:type III secretion translocon protein HrpF